MAGQRDIWKTLPNIFKIFHSKASLQWGKLCLAIYLIKLCLAILEALFFWFYYWLVLGDNQIAINRDFINVIDMKLWKTTHLSSQGFPKILVRKDISTNLLTASHISNCIIQQGWSQWFQKDVSINNDWFVFSNVTIVNIGGKIFALFCYESHLKMNLCVINAVFLRYNP